ncbi:MAG: NAD(P)H-hydrate dehydratase [Gemmatimonadota bacterium]
MADLPMLLPLLTAGQMRELERQAFGLAGLDERVVLESAGRAVAAAVAADFPEGRVVAAVGSGNNGGDAVVALRTLMAWGRDVVAVPLAGAEIPEGLRHGWDIPVSADPSVLATAGVILDGILGTGASGPPRDPVPELVESINAAGCPVVAIDGPTGVDMTSGAAPGAAVEARLTVTFGALKRGLLLHPGRRFAGRVLLAEVGFPPGGGDEDAAVVTDAWAFEQLPRIAPDAHKSSVGLVGLVAGRHSVGGAAIMAAMGALRAGCGGVRVASAEANRSAIHAAVPEAVFVDRDDPDLLDPLSGTAAVLIGPGIGTDESARALLERILAGFDGPLLLDADALTLVAREPSLLPSGWAAGVVMTPHPGELGRLLGRPTAEVLADRFASAVEAAGKFGCTVLSKGAPSMVAASDGRVLVSVSGHSGVATGGMGDTLGGIVAAFLAGGVQPVEAAAAGLHFAGRAAEAAGRGRGLLPRDVAESLPEVLLHRDVSRPTAPFIADFPPAR